MDIHVDGSGHLSWNGHRVRCALGRGGVAVKGGEGDGITPVGCFPLRRVMVRADRHEPPDTGLPLSVIEENHGWCDDPASPDYNTRITLPHEAGHEKLWRDDGLYDLVVEVGYNDAPIVPGRGSAIFLHIARPDYGPTEGCIALKLGDMLDLLRNCNGNDRLIIRP